jgi:hypothetical protein
MVLGINSEYKNNNSMPLKSNLMAQVIRDDRFLGTLPEKGKTPNFCNYVPHGSQVFEDNEQRIAFAFEKKDLVDLTKLLCEPAVKPFVIQKTKNSPLYIYINPNENKSAAYDSNKNGILETAIFLLVNDQETLLKDVADSFKLLTDRSLNYKPPLKLMDAFHERLGLFENLRKTDEIIQKLKNTGKGLGFTD